MNPDIVSDPEESNSEKFAKLIAATAAGFIASRLAERAVGMAIAARRK